MKIKNQFIICIGVFSVVLFVIAASVANTEMQVAQLNAQEAISNNIERGASNLNSISIDFFLYQEDLQLSKMANPVFFPFKRFRQPACQTICSNKRLLTRPPKTCKDSTFFLAM